MRYVSVDEKLSVIGLVHLVSFVQPNKQDKPKKPNNGLSTLTAFFSILLGMGMLLTAGVALAEESRSVPPSSTTTEQGSDYLNSIHGIKERADAQTGKHWIEPADAVLNQRKELEWSRYLKAALKLPDWVDLGIENRTRFESYDHPWRTSQTVGDGSTDSQIVLRSRLRLGLGGNGPVRFLFEGQDARAYLDRERGDFRDTTTVNQYDILQLLGSLTLDNVGGSGLRTDLHFGRMTMDFGRRRLIARNDFRNTSNAFDGVHWQIGQDKTWRIRAFFVEPVIRHEVSLDEQNNKSGFWGTYLESRHFHWLQLDAYYLGLNDRLADVATHRTYSTYGLRLYKDPKPGEMDYELESAWQTGTRGVTDHFAHFQHLDLGYMFDVPWSPRFLVHYDYASGDRKPGDSQDEGFDTLFGARRFEYMPTGAFGPFFRTNLSSPGWRIIAMPAQGWTVQLKQRFWYLAQSQDSFGSSGLRDSTGGSGNDLGHDVELRAQWALSNNLLFDTGYVHWFKGSYFDRLLAASGLPASGNIDTDYFYFQMRVRL
jgi:hypothetical protein